MIRKSIYQYIAAGCWALCLVFTGCNDNEPKTNDPGSPVVLNRFYPTTGGVGTEILITGKNFSEDPSQISVALGGKKLPVVGSNMNNIMVVVPKKLGTGNIDVKVGSHEAVSTLERFTYTFSAVVTTLAGNGEAGYGDGPAAEAYFDFGSTSTNWWMKGSICADSEGNVYVSDVLNYCIRKIDTEGTVSTLAGLAGVTGAQDGTGSAARFGFMYGMDCDADGNIYVATATAKTIRKITPEGDVTTVATAPVETWGVAVDKRNGTVYIVNYNGGVYRWDGDNDFTHIGDDTGMGIAVSPDGDVYVSSHDKHVIIKYAADTWEREVFAGNGEAGYKNGPLLASQFSWPGGLTFDEAGDLYVAGDRSFGGNADQSIRRIDMQRGVVETIAGGGTAGYANANGTAASFNMPQDLSIDGNGIIYVFDKGNNVVRKIVYE